MGLNTNTEKLSAAAPEAPEVKLEQQVASAQHLAEEVRSRHPELDKKSEEELEALYFAAIGKTSDDLHRLDEEIHNA